MAINASQLFAQMDAAIEFARHERQCSSPTSPQREPTLEAEPGCVFTLTNIALNVPTNVRVDLRWAVANMLHFFAATEDASMLHKYNRHAERFAPDGKWVGAYGAIAGEQLYDVANELRASPDSRRAIVSMGKMLPMDLNRPACWNHLHFLKWGGYLDLLVEQRSLNLHGVMVYDLVVLTNLLNTMAYVTDIPAGNLRWRIGSLHKLKIAPVAGLSAAEPKSLLLPTEALIKPPLCLRWLNEPARADEPYRSILLGEQNAG